MKNREIAERMKYLDQVIQDKEKEIAKLPRGAIRAVTHGKGFQYYLRKDAKDNNGIYMPKTELKQAERMIQREYDEKIVKKAKAEKFALERLYRLYQKGCVDNVYDCLPKGKQVMVTPIRETEEQFLERWRNMKYDRLSFKSDMPEYYTNRGERVRSKSEVIIANLLDKLQIPYIYEMPLILSDGIIVHPDFTLIDTVDRKIIVWEHLGMLDDEGYMNNAITKIRQYEKSGYYVGEQLLLTGESSMKMLDVKAIENKLKHLFAHAYS